MKTGIIMPAYNEEKRIGNTLKEYSSFYEDIRKKKKDFDYNIIVSINNTTDDTQKIVDSISKKNKRISSINLEKGGKGYAIIEGFKQVIDKDFDFLGFVDADNATSAQAFYDLLMNIKKYDGIIGSRYIKGSFVEPKQSFKRVISSRIYNLIIRLLFHFKYKDTQCGAKIFKKDVVKSIVHSIGMTQWSFDIDLLYKIRKKGYFVLEFPTTWRDRDYSKLNFFKAGPRMVLSVILLRVIESPFRRLLIPLNYLLKLGDNLINKK